MWGRAGWFTQEYWGTAVGRTASWGGKCAVEETHLEGGTR